MVGRALRGGQRRAAARRTSWTSPRRSTAASRRCASTASYLDGLGYDMDPDEFLRGNADDARARVRVRYAVEFELMPL